MIFFIYLCLNYLSGHLKISFMLLLPHFTLFVGLSCRVFHTIACGKGIQDSGRSRCACVGP
jgi:hypothetical protein